MDEKLIGRRVAFSRLNNSQYEKKLDYGVITGFCSFIKGNYSVEREGDARKLSFRRDELALVAEEGSTPPLHPETQPMETFVYLNGKFWDRVSNTPEEMAKSLGAELVSQEEFDHEICGRSIRCQLSIPFRVIGISDNRNAFGLFGVIAVNRKGHVYQFASNDIYLPKKGEDLKPPFNGHRPADEPQQDEGYPCWASMGFEIPERLKADMPENLLKEIFKD